MDFVINTHVHGDHIGNNPALSMGGATIIAHDNILKRMLDDGVSGPDGKTPPGKHMLPEITFSDGVTLHLNGHRAHVIHVSARAYGWRCDNSFSGCGCYSFRRRGIQWPLSVH